jgi:putative selenium metabolism protein SsnA
LEESLSSQIIIENAQVIENPLHPELKPDFGIVITDDLITQVGPIHELDSNYPDASRINARGLFVLPGLIDAHTHMYSALTSCMPLHGTPPQIFHEVLSQLWWKFDKVLLEEEDIAISTLIGSIASLKSGITTVIDHHSSPNFISNSLDVIAKNFSDCGLRSCLAYETSDRDGPGICDAAINENVRFIKSIKSDDKTMLQGLFGLHAVYSLSDSTLRKCASLSKELDAGFHMHMAEHNKEVEQFSQTHKQSIPEFLSKIGILGPKTILAHTVHINSDDIDILKETKTNNVHNPHSNMSNGVGTAPIIEMINSGQPVGLGSDGFYDLPYEMMYAKLLQTMKYGNPSAFSDQMTLSLVYDHNVQIAEKIFGCRLGRIAQGYKADLLFIEYDPFTPINKSNLSSHILSALVSGHIRNVLINGKFVVKDGSVSGIDEEKIKHQSIKVANRIWKRM